MSRADARFPGFDVLSQFRNWDSVTAGVVLARVGMPPDITFFTLAEQAAATSLCQQLLGASDDHADGLGIAVVNMIDQRLAANQTDGWHYEDMPPDDQAWRLSLAALDREANDQFGASFALCSPEQQHNLVQSVRDLDAARWHDMTAQHVWSLWTRYSCTAFYSHPAAWNEIGFPGPAFPRGYKNRGLDAREPFEVRDARPAEDPVRDDLS